MHCATVGTEDVVNHKEKTIARVRVGLAIAVIAGLALAASPAAAREVPSVDQDPGRTGIPGEVVDLAGAPIPGALVRITPTDRDPELFSEETTTDASGDYAVDLEPGFYVVRVEAQGYVGEYWSNARISAYARELSLSAGRTEDVSFDLAPLSSEVGRVTADMRRAPTAASESILANAVADMLRAQPTRDSSNVAAIVSPYELHADLLYAQSAGEGDGVVTYEELAAVISPDAVSGSTILTGAQIRGILTPSAATTGGVGYGLSGITYTVDETATGAARLQNVVIDGQPMEGAGEYRVAYFGVSASGGFETESHPGWALEGAIRGLGRDRPIASGDLAQKSIGLNLHAATASNAPGYSALLPIVVTMSSLDFVNTPARATLVEASIAGIHVGSGAIDHVVDPARPDAIGHSQLTVSIPTGVVGEVPLELTTSTGTFFSIPITVYSGPPPAVKVPSRAWGVPTSLVPRSTENLTFVAHVIASGTPTGVVTVFDGSKAIASRSIDARGRAVFTLPPLSPGLHKLSVDYPGDVNTKPSKSVPVPVFVRAPALSSHSEEGLWKRLPSPASSTSGGADSQASTPSLNALGCSRFVAWPALRMTADVPLGARDAAAAACSHGQNSLSRPATNKTGTWVAAIAGRQSRRA
ncbi:hypothetical protein GCM10009777_14610 [Microbacterium pumilum]|uniref:Alpha-amylase n=1 Tax=Microbacterium pumilum TaxID=344165 RepID=A0ABN2S7S5_9MICO